MCLQMKSSKKLYLINCGDYVDLRSGNSSREVVINCLDELFQDKKLNISPTLIVLDVKKCLRSLDLSGNVEFFSVPELLLEVGKKDLAESVRLVQKHLYG